MLHDSVPLPYPWWSWPQSVRAKWLGPLAHWVFHHAAACIFELDHLPAHAAKQDHDELPDGYSFRQAGMDEMPACAEMVGFPHDVYQRRCADGEECYVVYAGDTPVNLTWLHFGPCYVRGMGLRLDVPQRHCYLYNVVTDRRCRGQGLYKITQRRIIRLLAARGIERIRQLVMRENAVPQATLPKLGYRLTELIQHEHVMGVSLTTIDNVIAGNRRWLWLCRRPTDVFHI